jgi:hypothetical protein
MGLYSFISPLYRIIYGLYIINGFYRIIYGLLFICMYGLYMGYTWIIYGLYMDSIWILKEFKSPLYSMDSIGIPRPITDPLLSGQNPHSFCNVLQLQRHLVTWGLNFSRSREGYPTLKRPWLLEANVIIIQWEFQDPKMEVRSYHIRPYFVGIFPVHYGIMETY